MLHPPCLRFQGFRNAYLGIRHLAESWSDGICARAAHSLCIPPTPPRSQVDRSHGTCSSLTDLDSTSCFDSRYYEIFEAVLSECALKLWNRWFPHRISREWYIFFWHFFGGGGEFCFFFWGGKFLFFFLLAFGFWLLASAFLLLALAFGFGFWLLASGFSLLAIFWLLAFGFFWLLASGFELLASAAFGLAARMYNMLYKFLI